MQVPFGQLPFEVIYELRKRKWTAFFIFLLVSAAVLIAGIFWQEKYRAAATIFVDDQSVLRPLMEGSAVSKKAPDRIDMARQVIYSRKILGELVADEKLWGAAAKTPEGQEALIAELRKAIVVQPRGDNFFAVSYSDSAPGKTFQVTNKLTQLFVQETESSSRLESRTAYEFVDKQVKAYQAQLQASEERLKKFLAENKDGTEADAQGRIAGLQRDIEQTQIQAREILAQNAALKAQIQGESRLVSMDTRGQAYRMRIQELQSKLENLRLVYHDTYPDIVSLKQQISDLQAGLASEMNQPIAPQSPQEASMNPIYQELRTQLAKSEAQLDTLRSRENSLKALLQEEHARMARIQEKKAVLAELTRDNQVNQEIYNDLLRRREKARVSMRLDVEGQGLSYRVHEPPVYPIAPDGPRFLHFASAGLLLGLLAPIGLLAGALQVDPRVRVASVFEENTGIPVLTSIPHVQTPMEHRSHRRRTIAIGVCALFVAVLYGWVCWLKFQGVIA